MPKNRRTRMLHPTSSNHHNSNRDISEAENSSVGYENKIDEINGVIKFIREKKSETKL